MQLGRTDPFCVLLHGPTLIFCRGSGSVKHEGPSTSKRLIGEICQALLHRSLHVVLPNVRAMCSDFPGHRCLVPPAVMAPVLLPSPVHLVAFATFSSIFPVFLAFRCRETFDTLEAGTRAGSRAWNFRPTYFWFLL